MTPEQQREVWGMLDREHLAQVARKGPEPVFATISGAHLYGFASPDSDVDLRGAFLLPASEVHRDGCPTRRALRIQFVALG